MAQTTTDHETIRRWVEERGGGPARVKATGDGEDPGILRIDFPGYSGKDSLESIEWDAFFQWFDENGLAFLYQDRTKGGRQSRFNKLVARAAAEEREQRRDAARESGEGEADALAMLEAQHRYIEALADELFEIEPGSPDFRSTFLTLADGLAIHTTIEERIFYPGVKRPETAKLLEQSVEEHLRAKQVLATLLEASPAAAEELEPELEELAGLTEAHILEEEHELFPLVRKLVSAEERAQLGLRMDALTQELLEEGEPRTHVPQETEQAAPI
jgi:hypothetical protein